MGPLERKVFKELENIRKSRSKGLWGIGVYGSPGIWGESIVGVFPVNLEVYLRPRSLGDHNADRG